MVNRTEYSEGHKMKGSGLSAFLFAFMASCWVSAVVAQDIMSDIPFKPDVEARYLFYLHSKLMEQQGIPASHKKLGDYEFLDILKRLRTEGFNVIAEWRPREARLHPYAFRTARRVKGLIEKGVPASSITVAGPDKGGNIALVVASYVGDPLVNYVILGGCFSDEMLTESFKEKFELIPAGRILSIQDEGFKKRGSCAPYLTQAERGTLYQETLLSTAEGQGVFYRPDNRWIEPLRQWAEGGALGSSKN